MIGLEERATGQPQAPPPARSPIGRVITGILVILVGAAWFLDLATDVEIRWGTVLPIALIVVGIGVMYGANRQDVSGLVVIGIILSLIVISAGFFSAAPWEGVGEVTQRPAVVADLKTTYEHGVGDFTVDLRDVSLEPGTTTVDVSLGIGALRVLVPDDVTVKVDASAGLGKVIVFGQVSDGMGPNLSDTVAASADHILELQAGVGIGEVEVIR